jgi:O-methyltransferase
MFTSMANDVKGLTKRMLFGLPLPLAQRLGSLAQLVRFGEFVKHSELDRVPHFTSCSDLYRFLHDQMFDTVRGTQPLTYLEFGVYRGESMVRWTAIDSNADSRFFGFDSFDGLPEPWKLGWGKTLDRGYFSTDGRVPDLADSRVCFVKGLFQETLPSFVKTFQQRGQLVVHCDADLYTSTLYVLSQLNELLLPGSLIVFDEFGTVNHEFRAFVDYTTSFQRRLVPVGWAGRFYEVVAFRIADITAPALLNVREPVR